MLFRSQSVFQLSLNYVQPAPVVPKAIKLGEATLDVTGFDPGFIRSLPRTGPCDHCPTSDPCLPCTTKALDEERERLKAEAAKIVPIGGKKKPKKQPTDGGMPA